jgi:hypothetical protein
MWPFFTFCASRVIAGGGSAPPGPKPGAISVERRALHASSGTLKTPAEWPWFCVSLTAATRLFAMLEVLVLENIALADLHLREAEERIAAQRLRIANSVGQEREKAEALLETFLDVFDQMQKHRTLLNEELRLCRLSYYALWPPFDLCTVCTHE